MSNDNEKITRKLKAILSADVKGYSLLMADDEVHTIQTLKSYRSLMSDLIQQHSGRVVDNPGDNLLAEFSSAVEAVQCAVKIQKILKEKNEDLPKDKRLEFRIGVNIGDVIQDKDRIYGTGVNVAARIEGLADPGGICISRNAYDHIKDKLKLGYEYLGDHEVKNIKDPVRVYKVLMDPEDTGKLMGVKKKASKLKWALIAIASFLLIAAGVLGGLYWKYLYLPAPADIDPEKTMTFELPKGPSIAVLPFDNMTGDKNLEYLSDGITENVISALSHIPELFVIARNSSFFYKGKPINIQQVSKELGARYVIEGSIHKSEERYRIIVQLIDAQSGLHKWSETYDRKPNNLIELQDDIAFEILKAMQVKIKGAGNIRELNRDTNNFQEYKKLLRGSDYLIKSNQEANKLAQIEAVELIEINPKSPSAYALLAATYINDLWYDGNIKYLFKATEATRKALSLDNTYYLAHRAAGFLFLMRKEHDKAIDSCKMAITLNPSNADSYYLLGYILVYTDELEEALDNFNKAFRLNPLPPARYYFGLGFAYQDAQQFDKAIEEYIKCIELDPNYWPAHVGMVVVYGHMGDRNKAKGAISELLSVRPDFSKSHFLKTMPFKNKTTRDFVDAGLSNAGLID